MNLVLKRFSQDVNLEDPEQVNYFFVFEKDDGSEVRLPVQKETTEALVVLLYSKKDIEKNAEEEDSIPDGEEEVEEFSHEPSQRELLDPELYPDELDIPVHVKPGPPIPESEEDIPSL